MHLLILFFICAGNFGGMVAMILEPGAGRGFER